MLFMVIHTHTPELCPSDKPEMVKKTVDVVASKEHAKKCGVKVLGSFIAPPEHVLFFIIESNDYDKIVDFLRPMMKMGTPRIIPIGTLGEIVPKFKWVHAYAKTDEDTKKRDELNTLGKLV